MEDRIKRQYTKRSPRWGFGTQENSVQPETPEITPEIPAKEIRFEDLPERIRKGVEGSISFDIAHGQLDNGEARKQRAVEYYIYDKERRG